MNSPRSTNLPARMAYETAVEDLAKLLQDTGSSVQRILSSFSIASTKQPLLPRVPDVRTSLCIGITPSSVNNRDYPLPAETRSLLDNEGTLMGTLNSGKFCTPASKALQHQQDVQNWFAQVHPENAGHGKTLCGSSVFDFNEDDTSANEKVLKVFLEEIRRTVGNWSTRQKALGQDKASSTRIITHTGNPVISAPGLPKGPPLSLGFNKQQNKKALGAQQVREVLVHQAEKELDETACVIPQQGKEAEQSLLKSEHEKSARLDKVVDDIASQLLQSDDEDTRPKPLEEPPAARTQDLSEKEKATGALAAAEAGIEQESTSQAAPVATEVNGDGTTVLEAATPLTDNFVTPTKADQASRKLPVTRWKPPSSVAKSDDRTLSFPRSVEVISSPDWLPEGWVTELKTRGSGNSAGSKDKYFVDPVSNRRFRSRKEVVAYIERGKPKLNDSPERSPIRKLLGPEPLPAVPKKSHKKKKPQESSTPSSSGLPPPTAPAIASSGAAVPKKSHKKKVINKNSVYSSFKLPAPMVPPIASSGAVGNMYMPQYRTGQPSEWLLYESLAGLPFPMYDPFYYGDFSANKSSSSKGSHMPARPWFFSGPEASWSPRSMSGEKGRDYQSYIPMPSYPSVDGATRPSAGGSKKRKSGEL